MRTYDDAVNYVSLVNKEYHSLKEVFQDFITEITNLNNNEFLGLTIEKNDERSAHVYFLNMKFILQFCLERIDKHRFTGKLSFLKIEEKENPEIEIGKIFFDEMKNVKNSLADKVSVYSLRPKNSCCQILLRWLSDFIMGENFNKGK